MRCSLGTNHKYSINNLFGNFLINSFQKEFRPEQIWKSGSFVWYINIAKSQHAVHKGPKSQIFWDKLLRRSLYLSTFAILYHTLFPLLYHTRFTFCTIPFCTTAFSTLGPHTVQAAFSFAFSRCKGSTGDRASC